MTDYTHLGWPGVVRW